MKSDREYLRTHPWISFRHHLERADPIHWSLLGEAAARCEQVACAVLPPADALAIGSPLPFPTSGEFAKFSQNSGRIGGDFRAL